MIAENISAPHGFTTRFGGVSSGYLDSLNIGTRRGDDPQNVLKNYEILGQELGFVPEELVLTRHTVPPSSSTPISNGILALD